MNLNRRQFLKVFGLGMAVAMVASTLVLEEIIKKTYDFIPGTQYRHAVCLYQSVNSISIERRREMVGLLDEWLRRKIHPDYLDFNMVDYDFQDSDWGMIGGVGVCYVVPEKPISKINRRKNKIDSIGIKLKGINYD